MKKCSQDQTGRNSQIGAGLRLLQKSRHHTIMKDQMEIFVQSDLDLFGLQTSAGFYVSAVQVFGKHYWKRRNCS